MTVREWFRIQRAALFERPEFGGINTVAMAALTGEPLLPVVLIGAHLRMLRDLETLRRYERAIAAGMDVETAWYWWGPRFGHVGEEITR